MAWKCVLDPELHECPHFIRATGECTKGEYCCFRDPENEPAPEKKEKWFEKYYKK